MTVSSQRLISQFSSRAAERSYFNGCSLGGRQGLEEAQRYPQDYDGIISGDIAHNISDLYAARLTQHQFAHRTAQSSLSDAALKVLNDAAIQACDQLDGVRDGVIENPLQCHVDPATVACGAPGAPSDCLNAEQVETARFVYAPVRRPDNGTVVSNGLMPGSEGGWRAILGAEPEINSVEVYRYMVFKNPTWDWRAFNLAGALPTAKLSEVPQAIDAVNPDLRAFFARGGKLLMTHGWADPQTPPRNGLDYYEKVRSTVGAREGDSSLRM
jgi:feruloyl esterase